MYQGWQQRWWRRCRRVLALGVLVFGVLALVPPAAGSELADQISQRSWFGDLTPTQQGWLVTHIDSGLGGGPEQTAYFYSLEPELVLYASSALEKVIHRGPPVPHAVEAGKDDWGAQLGKLKILDRQGSVLQVECFAEGQGEEEGEEGKRGWIHRSAIRLDSLVLAQADGTYLGDLVPAFQSGGSRARLVLRARQGRLFLAVRYIKTYRGEDEKWFAFEVAEGGELLDVFPWPEETLEVGPEATTADLSEDVVKALDHTLGLGATGFIRHRDGRTEPGQRYFVAWDSSRAVASNDELLILDSSFYSNTSPARP